LFFHERAASITECYGFAFRFRIRVGLAKGRNAEHCQQDEDKKLLHNQMLLYIIAKLRKKTKT